MLNSKHLKKGKGKRNKIRRGSIEIIKKVFDNFKIEVSTKFAQDFSRRQTTPTAWLNKINNKKVFNKHKSVVK
jgi:hypothetical protein